MEKTGILDQLRNRIRRYGYSIRTEKAYADWNKRFILFHNKKHPNALVYWATRAWYKWLNRRSQRARLNWERFQDLLKDYPLPQPKVYVNLWDSP